MQRSITNNQGLLARALAAHQAGNVSEAEFLFKLVLQSDKKQFDALHMLGVIEGQRGNFAAGLRRLNEALRIRPNAADALINLGRVQSELGDNAGAIATYRKVLSLNPRSALAHNNFSVVLYRQRQLEEALAHCDAAIGIARDYADAWNNRGNVLFGLERWNDALESYDRALILQPRLAEAYLGRGNVLHQLKRYDDALAAYDSALAINPSHAECHFGRGNVLNVLQNREDEFAAYAKAFALKPDLQNAEGARLFAKMRICDWDNLEAECAHLVAMAAQGLPRSTPFTMIATSVSPADQMKCGERYMADRFPASPHPLWRGECYRHERIRVAYLASEFHNHVVAYVTAGMFEAHDRSRFEITAVSFGPDSDDEMRSRLRRAFDRFLDVRTRSDQEIAEVLRDLEIDIAVDLTGFTGFARTSILARRVAPVQVSYLGFAGTMAASYVDYIVADHTVIPPEHSAFYTEKVVRLPDTYQVYDAKLAIAPLTPPRDQLELPAEGFIFCSFNNAYKIRPETFDVWMRLLKQVEGSVLWLFLENAAVSRNLRREAERRGVAPERLVFAPHFPLPEHLARHRQADLALDTLPYNGHATTSHALWAGVPVVTCLGTTFAGRVAASVLRAAGLPELVTESLEDYEALASKIASEPAYCASLMDKLARNRQAFPLFDTERFTRHLEAAYTTMWQRSQSGAPPQSFAVEPLQCSDRA